MPSAVGLWTGSTRWVVAVFLVAAAALGYQLLLLRWLAIAHWQPFAWLVISLALLGHGASGSLLALVGARAQRNAETLFPAAALAFGISTLVCTASARLIPFNGLALVWEPRQWLWLSLLYLWLALPFLFAASCFGLAFLRFGDRVPLLYAADLIGAGLGALAVFAALWVMPLQQVLAAVAVLAFIAALLTGSRRVAWIGAPIAVAALAIAGPGLAPVPNEYKGLPRLLAVSGGRVIEQRSSPYGLLSVVESPRVPLRHAPGISLSAQQEPPPQLALFTDGESLSPITRVNGNAQALAYLDQLPTALPYHLLRKPRVLVLGAGGGAEVLQALKLGARHIDALEHNPQRLELVARDYAAYAGRLYAHPRVRAQLGDARSHLRATDPSYDLIVLPAGDSFGAAVAGTQAVAESYAYTVEAFRAYRAHLAAGGWLAVTRWAKHPPRDGLKLFATAVAALQAEGADPAAQLVLLRSWQTATLLVKNGAVTGQDLATLRAFCTARGFDTAYYPGMRPDEANRHHVVARDWLHEGALALLGDASEKKFIEAYQFDIRPARDDRPFFFDFFRWRALPELLSLRAQGGAVLLDSAYLLMAAALIAGLLWSLVLILAPLVVLPRAPGSGRMRPAVHVLCLGLGFLFLEIAWLQRLTLILGHSLLAVTAVLSAVLLFAGLGSALAQHRPISARWPVAAIALLVLIGEGVWPAAIELGLGAGTAAKLLLAIVLVAPLAFCMGMPFPLALARLAREQPAFLVWAWGINGCASVLSAILAALLAVHFGFAVVCLTAAALYLLAAAVWLPSTTGPSAAPRRRPLTASRGGS